MRPFEYLFLRNIRFDYICPPICEALFSSTGEPTILLEVFDTSPVVGLEYEWDGSNFTIKWSAYPGALCYSVYRVENGTYVLVAECVPEIIIPDEGECYVVTAITPEGETPPSGVICPVVAGCPAWISEVVGDAVVACGSDIILTAEADVPGFPGTTISYVWLRDGTEVFAETKVGATTYAKEGVNETDTGTYTLKATANGCTIESSFAVEVAGCGGGGGCPCGTLGNMPTDFLEPEDPEVIEQTITATPAAGNAPDSPVYYTLLAGEYELRYLGGSQMFCEVNDPNNCPGTSAKETQVSVFHDVWCETRNPGPFSANVALFMEGDTTPEVGNIPPIQCQNGAALQVAVEATAAAASPLAFNQVIEPVIGKTNLDALSHTWSADLWPNVNFHTCGGQNGDADATINTTFQIVRTRRFIDQPPRSIDAWNTVRALIEPADAIAQVWPGSDAWTTGDFDQEAIRRQYNAFLGLSPSVTYQFNDVYAPLIWLREPTIKGGWVNCRRSKIDTAVGPTGYWRLTIWGEYTTSDPMFPNQANILWRGKKFEGTTANGAYCWEASFDPSLELSLPCIVLL